jgi:hypothetical protein
MTERNILPYDGQAILIDDHGAGFDWPAITRTLIDTIPWQVETARIFGREMPIPRMTAWFGDGAIPTAVSYICWPVPGFCVGLAQSRGDGMGAGDRRFMDRGE